MNYNEFINTNLNADYTMNAIKVRIPMRSDLNIVKRYQEGDPDAAEELLEAYSDFIKSYVRKFDIPESVLDRDDLMQEGALGLYKAARDFDFERGTEFSTFARHHIFNAIVRAVEYNGYAIRIPSKKREKIIKVTKLNTQFSYEKDMNRRMELIAESAKMSVKGVQECLFYSDYMTHTTSLDSLTNEEGEGDWDAVFCDDDECPVENAVSHEALKDSLQQVLHTLLGRERLILEMRFGLYDGTEKTQAEIGEYFHISASRVGQIEEKALRKLRHPNRNRKLKDFLE